MMDLTSFHSSFRDLFLEQGCKEERVGDVNFIIGPTGGACRSIRGSPLRRRRPRWRPRSRSSCRSAPATFRMNRANPPSQSALSQR